MILFAAHPDDETIGAGGQLSAWRDLWIVHATDGAPRNMQDARSHGFSTREHYAHARRQEFLRVLEIAGIDARRGLTLDFVDQECSRNLAALVKRIGTLLRDLRPSIVLAPPYEGGHPDHDSVAFAVHTACAMLAQQSSPPQILEFTQYHAREGEFRAGEFLESDSGEYVKIRLSDSAESLKRCMVASYVTQQATLAPFELRWELFRAAPRYDFGRPPHEGKLYYENFNWGVSGAEWRELAAAAESELRMEGG